MLYALPANAVHDTGKFQLDGNAQTSDQSNPPATEDWDKVCPANHPQSLTCLGGNTADRATFIADAFLSASDNIFKGGTDDADISSWQWKQAGPSPDKDDIEHAYAAQYTITAAGPYQNHKVLFFGGDRLANNGNTNIGFWFFHNNVTTGGSKSGTDANGNPTCSVNSGCGFTQLHTVGNKSLGGSTPGDLFILSAFTNGGAQPTIKIFEWVGPGNATKNYLGSNGCFTNACTLQPLPVPNTPGFNDNRCDVGGPTTGDVACAIVNGVSKPSPWVFTDKTSGAPANTFGPSEFYEGGLDLTGLGFGEACFSSTLLNTRSSQSGTSVLQDFALGAFGSCGSSVVTTPSAGQNGSVSIGNGVVTVHDTAAVTVSGISTFSGSLNFHLCGPIATGNCATGGTAVAAKAGVNPITTNGNYDSADATISSVGRYCWRANYTSATTGVPDAADPASDSTSTTECFTVTPAQSSLDTQAVASAVNFGQPVQDNATLSNTVTQPGSPIINGPAGAPAGGKITFTLLKADCSTLATGTGSNPQDITSISGNATYGPVSFTPDAPGTYHWKAVYTPAVGDPNNLGSTHNATCNDSDETVVVSQIPTTIKTKQSWIPNDTATVAATSGNLAAGGKVLFRLYDNATCSGTALYSEEKTLTGGSPSEEVGTTNTTTFTITTGYADPAGSVAGPYSWKVVYTPSASDTAHTGKQSSCDAEHFSITYTNDSGPGSNLP
jgi:hypothetical protein